MSLHSQLIRGYAALLLIIGLAAIAAWAPPRLRYAHGAVAQPAAQVRVAAGERVHRFDAALPVAQGECLARGLAGQPAQRVEVLAFTFRRAAPAIAAL